MRSTKFSPSPWLLPSLTTIMTVGACATAHANNTITLRATRTALLADGKQTTDLIAEVRDSSGRPLSQSVPVQFQTTSGTLSQSQALTFSGRATVRLTSSPVAGSAKVTAFTPGGNSSVIDVVFTDDPEATFAGNSYMSITGPSYCAYSATDRAIEAQGKDGTARITYRNFDVQADRIQLTCSEPGSGHIVLRAYGNVKLKRGKTTINAVRVYYNLTTGLGDGVAEHDGHLKPVSIAGENLVLAPLPGALSSSHIVFPELQVKLVIVARSITFFPDDRLQFRRPKFYQDNVQILSLPYYELPLNSQELFSDQFISLGTNGFGLELPFYFNLSPRKTGIVFLRHQQQLGRSYYSYDPGWSIDLVQGYSSQGERKYEGAMGFTGLTRGNWGFRWSHNQEFNSATQGSLYLDFPQHNSVFTSANFSQQHKVFRWGENIAGGQTFGGGPSETSYRSDTFIETNPHKFGLLPALNYTLGTTFSSGQTRSRDAAIGNFNDTTTAVTMRAFTRPILLDKRTTLTNSFTIGQTWTNVGASGIGGLATLSLDHTMTGGGSVNVTYDLLAQRGLSYYGSGQHRLSMNYNIARGKRFGMSVFGSAFLDAPDSSVLADVSYRLDSKWRLLGAATLQRFQGDSYRDIQFIIGRQIGARELQLAYSTLYKRVSFDFTATRF